MRVYQFRHVGTDAANAKEGGLVPDELAFHTAHQPGLAFPALLSFFNVVAARDQDYRGILRDVKHHFLKMSEKSGTVLAN
jgi:hypothetical protein